MAKVLSSATLAVENHKSVNEPAPLGGKKRVTAEKASRVTLRVHEDSPGDAPDPESFWSPQSAAQGTFRVLVSHEHDQVADGSDGLAHPRTPAA